MKKVLTGSLVIIIFVCFTACKNPVRGKQDIENIMFIRTIGVDRVAGNEDYVKFTVSAKGPSASTESGQAQERRADILSAEGRTVFEAVRNLKSFADKNPFYGHVEFIIIGEDAAREDILKYLDFFTREHEFRLNSKIVVVSGATAEELLNTANTSEMSIADRMTNLMKNNDDLSIIQEVDLAELIAVFDNKYLSAYIPCIKLVNKIQKEHKESNTQDIEFTGFSIFKGTSLLGYITDYQARGFNWIKNKIKSGIIVVKDKSGDSISMEIIDSNTKILPEINNEELLITIKIQMTSNIGETEGREDIFKEDTLTYLEQQQSSIIKSEVESVLKYAQENNVDIFGFSDAIFHKYPVKWDNYKDKWEEIFPRLKVNILIDSKINRVYVIKQPTRSRDGKKK